AGSWAGGPAMPVKAPILKALPALAASDWEVEAGARLWFGTGRVDAPNPLFGFTNNLRSRIVFTDLDALSGETFARVDHSSGFFVKGFLGAGGSTRGKMKEENTPAGGTPDSKNSPT